MSFSITRSDLKNRVSSKIQGKEGMIADFDALLNSGVSEVVEDVDLRSHRRRATLSPNLFEEIYDYACPSDLDVPGIIDFSPQVRRNRNDDWRHVTSSEFDMKKEPGTFTIINRNGTRLLRISARLENDEHIDVDTLDGVGDWEGFGDGENLAEDDDNYVKGDGSIEFDISSAGGTTAGIKNTSVDSFDLDDDFLGDESAAFVWVYIQKTDNITNFKMHLGSDESNYHEQTVTAQHDGTAFVTGWNLLRFDLESLSDTGTPDDDAITYVAVYMTKDASKTDETGYRFDHIEIRQGQVHYVHYYTEYGWQNSSGSYIETASSDTDVLVANRTEFDKLIVFKCAELAAEETSQHGLADRYMKKYDRNQKKYKLNNPSEAQIITTTYREFKNIS